MDSAIINAENLRKVKDSMTEKQFLDLIMLVSKANKTKKLQSARNKRYYLKNRKDILEKEKVKNNLFKVFTQKNNENIVSATR